MRQEIRVAVERLTSSNVAGRDQLVGCSAAEIEEVESRFGVDLPSSYKDFLSILGRESGDFLHGTDFRYPYLLGLRQTAIDLLAESATSFSLEATHFVFLGHQGYQFMFFGTAFSDDPPVLWYMDTEPRPKQVSGSFSDWFLLCVRDEIEGFEAE